MVDNTENKKKGGNDSSKPTARGAVKSSRDSVVVPPSSLGGEQGLGNRQKAVESGVGSGTGSKEQEQKSSKSKGKAGSIVESIFRGKEASSQKPEVSNPPSKTADAKSAEQSNSPSAKQDGGSSTAQSTPSEEQNLGKEPANTIKEEHRNEVDGFTTPPAGTIDISRHTFTDKQRMFAKNYIIDFNATQAAIRAGYSKKAARQAGSDQLSNPYIRELIRRESEKKVKKIDNLTDRIVDELVKIGFSDIKGVLSFDAGGVVMKPSEDVDGTIIAEVSSSDTKEGINMKAKLHDKMKALELLGRFQGIWQDKLQVEKKEPVQFAGEEKL